MTELLESPKGQAPLVRRHAEDRSDRRRKVMAILAAGSVVGAGAIVTLAAWNDSEYATTTLAAGRFNIEGSTDSTTYTGHSSTGTAATLPFTATISNLAPGDVLYAKFAVRLDAASTRRASVAMQAPTTTGAITGLTYRLVTTAGTTCDAAAVSGGTTLVAAGTAMNAGTGAFNLARGTGGNPGAPVNLCYAITADDALVQGQTGTATWQFLATQTGE